MSPTANMHGNQNYFIYHNKPDILITPGEYYSAILHPDFVYVSYFAASTAIEYHPKVGFQQVNKWLYYKTDKIINSSILDDFKKRSLLLKKEIDYMKG